MAPSTLRNKNQKLMLILIAIALAMFAFGYALVPLYNVFCEVTGINGKPSSMLAVDSHYVDKTRWVTVEFDATNNASLAWKFYPLTRKIKLHPGENKRVIYYAKNNSGSTMTVQAIPSITPGLAAKFLKKTECFCFSQQILKNGEKIELPIIFHLEPDLPKSVKVLTLSYTLFDATGYKARKNSKVGKL